MKEFNKTIPLVVSLCLVMSGCANTQSSNTSPKRSFLESAKLEVQGAELVNTQTNDTNAENSQGEKFRLLPKLDLFQAELSRKTDVLSSLSETKDIKLAVEGLKLSEFVHFVLGEKLQVSYVLDDSLKQDSAPVTLNIQAPLSQKELFALTEELLIQRNYTIRINNDVFYLHQASQGGQQDVVYGYGRNVEDLPNTSLEILQMVPFKYGTQVSLAHTLRQFLNIDANYDQNTGGILLKGKRKEILRAMELIRIMDTPVMKDRNIAVYKPEFMDTASLLKSLTDLLKQEGISLGTGTDTKSAISYVELAKQNSFFLFANSNEVIERAVFWAEQLDKPIKTLDKQYFIYAPVYSRARELGESLQALISGGASFQSSTSANSENNTVKGVQSGVVAASSENMKMIVDERSNNIIFHTSGDEYRALLPLVKKLDVAPKQIILEMVIAEVTLTDEFKQGVEFALAKGNYGVGTKGAFLGEGFGGLSYLVKNATGELNVNLFESNSLVNVLSRPSLVVRDGVSANITVGTDIPVVGQTTSDPLTGQRQTTSVEYRKTGVDLKVTPVVNAQGIVFMKIAQKISNQVDAGATTVISPSVFERSISTEVMAESGQTIILGGLISENKSDKSTKVPLLGDIPVFGHLFRADTDSGNKTELVVLVTPRVIENNEDWKTIKSAFQNEMQKIKIN